MLKLKITILSAQAECMNSVFGRVIWFGNRSISYFEYVLGTSKIACGDVANKKLEKLRACVTFAEGENKPMLSSFLRKSRMIRLMEPGFLLSDKFTRNADRPRL